MRAERAIPVVRAAVIVRRSLIVLILTLRSGKGN
jgi:hypothetical protein